MERTTIFVSLADNYDTKVKVERLFPEASSEIFFKSSNLALNVVLSEYQFATVLEVMHEWMAKEPKIKAIITPVEFPTLAKLLGIEEETPDGKSE